MITGKSIRINGEPMEESEFHLREEYLIFEKRRDLHLYRGYLWRIKDKNKKILFLRIKDYLYVILDLNCFRNFYLKNIVSSLQRKIRQK